MNEIEPTQETLAWICKNAEQAWEEGDPKKLQFWEDQKKEFQQKCYQRIESLVRQKSLLQQQQEVLIQKVKTGEYTPEQANQIHQQIYEHSEELKRQIHFYRKLLEYPANEAGATNADNIANTSHVSEIPFQEVVPIERYFYELFMTTLRVTFLSNIGQITLCVIILVIAVYFTWTWNTQNQQPQFEYIATPEENKHIIHIHNRGMLSAKIYLDYPNRWEFAPYIYSINCSTEATSSHFQTDAQIPLNCFFVEENIMSPVTDTYIEIPPGSQKSLGVNIQCIKQYFPDIITLSISIRKLFFRTEVLKVDIHIPSSL